MKVLCLYLVLALAPSLASGQARQTRLLGRVLQADGQAPIAGASVTLGGSQAITNERGNFVFENAAPGNQVIRFEMLGYLPRTDSILIAAGQDSELVARLTVKPVSLPPLAVAVRPGTLVSNGYYDRRDKSGLSGRFIERVEIDRKGPTMLTDLFQDIAGSRVHTGFSRRVIRFNREANQGLGTPVLSSAPGVSDPFERWLVNLRGCQPTLYVDGRAHSDRVISRVGNFVDDFNVIPPAVVEAVEVYVGANTPGEFRGNGCGVILIWTRRESIR